ncbi:MAG TPA: NUDIX domain-containing protein [Steroidobacteraceae bacterium]|nr:NUDIX domain-containing protein [Steroidobacteraceae bacterium]
MIDARGRVLIAQRPPGKHLAGMWEFPGGKIEPGEARVDALKRELHEEIGIAIETPRPLKRLRHTYAYGEVLLDIWVVRRYRGEPRSLDGQALRWCDRSSLGTAGLLPADRPIIGALRLPERLTVRDTPYYRTQDFEEFMTEHGAVAEWPAAGTILRGALCRTAGEARAAENAGADFLALRERVEGPELAALCEGLSAPVFASGLTPVRAWALGASGVNAIR